MKDLQELFDLYEADLMNRIQSKPQLQDEEPSSNTGPDKGNFEHPISQKKDELMQLIGTGSEPAEAHQQVYGEIDMGNIESKAMFASSLGKIADDGSKSSVVMEPEKGSILAKDADIEKRLHQTTQADLKTPINQQVPNDQQVPNGQQTPTDQVSEELEKQEEYDYNLDVAYLQQFGRA